MGQVLERNIMKLLILTQKIDADDPILGFFVRWACPVK